MKTQICLLLLTCSAVPFVMSQNPWPQEHLEGAEEMYRRLHPRVDLAKEDFFDHIPWLSHSEYLNFEATHYGAFQSGYLASGMYAEEQGARVGTGALLSRALRAERHAESLVEELRLVRSSRPTGVPVRLMALRTDMGCFHLWKEIEQEMGRVDPWTLHRWIEQHCPGFAVPSHKIPTDVGDVIFEAAESTLKSADRRDEKGS